MKDEIRDLVIALGVGADQAKTADNLAIELKLPVGRTAYRLRELARAANLEGLPVVAGPCGFYLAESFEEIRAYEQGLISRAMAILERARAMADVVPWSFSGCTLRGGVVTEGP